MPTRAGTPVPEPMLPAGPLNPFDWLSFGGNEALGAQQTPLMRGTGGALAFWQRRQIPGPPTVMQSREIFVQSRPYSRGAQAFAPQFGKLNINPIGAGVYSTYKLPVIAGPGARYQFGAIWFDVQSVPTSLHMSPTTPLASANAMIAQSYVAAMYATTG